MAAATTNQSVMAGERDGYDFAVCLSHDVDRIYKTYQYLWNGVRDRSLRELAGVLSAKNPYWTFERTMAIESALGVRSSFNVLDEVHLLERPVTEWFTKTGWKLFAGRYDVDDPDVSSALRVLDEFGWEIALHGSYTSAERPERLTYEKDHIESVVDTEIVGNRQHYWRLSRPETWRHLRDAGIVYDTSLGSTTEVDFQEGYELRRPFDDEFVVFPWSLMDNAAMKSAATRNGVLANCRRVLEDARAHRSVLVLNWHAGDVFSTQDYPGWDSLYRRLIEEALEMGAWVGPPGEFYSALSHPDGTVSEALATLGGRDALSSGRDSGLSAGEVTAE